MKKLITLIVILITLNTQAQTGYISASISIPNTPINSFTNNSYASVELGISEKNKSFGLCFGRSNINFNKSELYFTELKTYVSTDLKYCKGFIIMGLGNYISNKPDLFIEYGGGITYPINSKFDISLSISNWDGVTYLSPCLIYNL